MEAPLTAALDHLVVAARDLDEGVDYVRSCLGVAPEGGGRHRGPGTHNRVLRLGADVYLEVIAIDPASPPPDRPRWFALDDPAMQARLRERPRLITWVARTDDIHAAAARSPVPLGRIEPMQRGALHWWITRTAGGRLLGDGLIPALIQWETAEHPAARMAPSGCTLAELSARHPTPARIQAALAPLGLAAALRIEPAAPGAAVHLQAVIRTPTGPRTLT